MRCDVGAGGFAGAFFASGALLNYTLGGVARLQCFGSPHERSEIASRAAQTHRDVRDGVISLSPFVYTADLQCRCGSGNGHQEGAGS